LAQEAVRLSRFISSQRNRAVLLMIRPAVLNLALLVLVEATEKSGQHPQHNKDERPLTADEKKSWQVVTDDRNKLQAAMNNLNDAVKEQERNSRNSQHAISLAEDAQSQAAAAHKKETQQAMTDFNKTLFTIQDAQSSANWDDLELAAKQNKKIDRLQDEEERDARERLHDKRKDLVSGKVRQSYREAMDAARNLLKHRQHLQDAQRSAGRSQQTYEKEEMRNEFFAEHLRDQAENQKDRADSAAEHIIENAEDHLEQIQGQGRKGYDAASDARRHAIAEVEKAKQEAKTNAGADSTQSGAAAPEVAALNLASVPERETSSTTMVSITTAAWIALLSLFTGAGIVLAAIRRRPRIMNLSEEPLLIA